MDLIRFLFIVLQYHIALNWHSLWSEVLKMWNLWCHPCHCRYFVKKNKLIFFQKLWNNFYGILGNEFQVKRGTDKTIGKKDETLSRSYGALPLGISGVKGRERRSAFDCYMGSSSEKKPCSENSGKIILINAYWNKYSHSKIVLLNLSKRQRVSLAAK